MNQKSPNDAYQGLLGLDQLPSNRKTFIWVVCFVLAALSAVAAFIHLAMTIETASVHYSFSVLSVIGPSCIGAALLRLSGVSWRYALLLIVCVSMVVAGAYFVIHWIGYMSGIA